MYTSDIQPVDQFKVLVDTDGGIDDAWAILMLLAAEKRPPLELIGITCVYGNAEVEQTCINVLRTLDTRKSLNIPVFKGSSSPLVRQDLDIKPFFGTDGFGCAEHDSTPDLNLISEENAVVALNRIVNENKGKVSLLCLGPLTNIALAIRTYQTFEENLKEILIMGGNYKAIGNATNCAEYNFYTDPEAAYIVLNSAIKNKVLLPWETCLPLAFSLEWRDNVLGACNNAPIQLMNKVERPLRKKHSFRDWMPCDQVVAAVLLDQSAVTKSVKIHLTVELHGQLTRGQVVVDKKQQPNATLVKGVNKELLSQHLLRIHML